ncbi:MAG TPA: PorP/SprF family type IX secretion system membrane protein, partial [Cytophagaceae bacterium]
NFSAIVPFHNHKTLRSHWGGTGLSVYYDKTAQNGLLKNTGVNGSFAYNIFLGEFGYQQISFGLQAGLVQKQLNVDDLEWGAGYTRNDNSFDPSGTTSLTSNILYPDIASGIIWSYNAMKDIAVNNISAYAGVALYHINSPNTSLIQGKTYDVPRLYKFHTGLEWQLTNKVGFSPNILAAFQNNIMQLNSGLYLTYKLISSTEGKLANTSLIVGSWYRLHDGMIFSTGLSGQHYTLGFSYDLNNASLSDYSSKRGAYEISLAIRFIKKGNTRRYDSPRI